MKSEAAVWLVKSSGRIIGPHTQQQVRDMLRTQDITVIDEICSSTKRWQLLRDHPEFQDILDELRQKTYGMDDSTTRLANVTASMTETLPVDDNEITAEIMDFKTALKEIVLDNIPESQVQPPSPPARFQSAGDTADQEVRRAAEKGTKGLWIITGFILAALIAGLAVRRSYIAAQSQRTVEADPYSAGLTQYSIGNYSKAMEYLKQANVAQPDKKEIWLPLALLSIHLDGQTVEANRLIERVLSENNLAQAEGFTARSLAQISDGDLAGANESLDLALKANSNFVAAKVNRGVVSLLGKNYDEASNQFREVLQRGLNDGAVSLQLAAAEVLKWKSQGGKGSLKLAIDEVQRAGKSSFNYRQEINLAKLYLAFLNGSKAPADMVTDFRYIIDVDPEQSESFRSDLLYARQMSDWTHLGQWCRQLVEAAGESAMSQTLSAICLMKQGQSLAAKTAMEQAVARAPKDALVQAVYSAVLKSAGFVGEASAALGRSVELDRRGEFLLPSLLQARFCADGGDFECAKTHWMRVLQLEPNLPAAKMGLAQIYESMGSNGERDRILRELKDLAPNYKPYLQMAQKVKSQPKS